MMRADLKLFIDDAEKEAFLFEQPSGQSRLLQGPGVKIKVGQDGVRFTRQIVSVPPRESLVEVPVNLLARVGLLSDETLMQTVVRDGLWPPPQNKGADVEYHLYADQDSQQFFLLLHELHIDGQTASTPTADPSSLYGDSFDVPLEEQLQCYGAKFRVLDDDLKVNRGLILVPRRSKLIEISLDMLLAIGLTTHEALESLVSDHD